MACTCDFRTFTRKTCIGKPLKNIYSNALSILWSHLGYYSAVKMILEEELPIEIRNLKFRALHTFHVFQENSAIQF